MPTTIEALVVIALVLSPGYVFTQLVRRMIAHVPETTDTRFVLTITTAGTAIHGLLFPWSTRILDYYLGSSLSDHRLEVVLWTSSVILFVPVALGVLVGRLTLWRVVERALGTIGPGYIDRMPSAWDFVMRQRQPSYARIHLKDDQGMIGGIFADRSFASLDPGRADIYLEEAWWLDKEGEFDEKVLDTQGVWISADVMAYVHFLERPDNDSG